MRARGGYVNSAAAAARLRAGFSGSGPVAKRLRAMWAAEPAATRKPAQLFITDHRIDIDQSLHDLLASGDPS
jgi:hypothetical protein